LSTFADTAGAGFDTATAGFFGDGLFGAAFFAGERCAAGLTAAGFFAADFFAIDVFAAGFFAAALTAAFTPATVIALPDLLAATFLAGAGETPAPFVADPDTLAALPALPAVVRDFVETAMVSPKSGQECDDHRASVIASCISRFGLSNRVGRSAMYIVAIGWLYVVVMMALTETSFIAGLVTLVFYGLAPLALFLWLMGTPERRRRQRSRDQPDE
jgi:hypothetical protein